MSNSSSITECTRARVPYLLPYNEASTGEDVQEVVRLWSEQSLLSQPATLKGALVASSKSLFLKLALQLKWTTLLGVVVEPLPAWHHWRCSPVSPAIRP